MINQGMGVVSSTFKMNFIQILETNSEKPSQKHTGGIKNDPCLVAESSY